MSAHIVYVDDDSDNDSSYASLIAWNIKRHTAANRVVFHPLFGERLSIAAPKVHAYCEHIKNTAGYVAGIAVDVIDQTYAERDGGLKLVKKLREFPGYEKGSCPIVLVTVGCTLDGELPSEVDNLIGRLETYDTPEKAAKHLLNVLGLDEFWID